MFSASSTIKLVLTDAVDAINTLRAVKYTFDADADAYSETITVNGEHTALIVGKITTTFGTSQNIQFINYHVGVHRLYTG